MKRPSSPQPPADAAPRRARGRPRCFDCDQALDRAMGVFWEKGYEAASLQDLTEAMGINPPSLYAAFGDKEGLFVEAVKRYYTKVQGACPFADERTARGAVEKLLTELATHFTSPDQPRGCLATMAMTTTATTSERVQRILSEEQAKARANLRARIQRGIDEGELPRGTDAATLANLYGAVIAGMSLQAKTGVSRKALLAMVEAAMQAWPQAPKQAARAARSKAAA
jgi:AcrR family transcriptional regulator